MFYGEKMKPDESIEFELDEPAEKSHTPLGWPIQTIEIIPSGKAPKKYGANTYRFSAVLTLSVILPRRGWTLVKKTKNYGYFMPPPDQLSPPFKISIAIPPDEEVLQIARRSYSKGRSWIGQLGEWPAMYSHERNRDMYEIWRDPETGQIASRVHEIPPESSLTIGEWGAWQAHVARVEGDFVLPSSHSASITNNSVGRSILSEGALKTVELTLYERNAAARRLCILHYGLACQACGLNYENKYGSIGADLIHVHHVTPLSAIGEAYEVDPVQDLIPLCATCHHVVHRRDPPYSITEIRAAIAAQVARKANAE